MGNVLMLMPSRGLGGGFERYVETLESAFSLRGLKCRRLDLPRSGVRGHASLLSASHAAIRKSAERKYSVIPCRVRGSAGR
jgi:hypothetical protein